MKNGEGAGEAPDRPDNAPGSLNRGWEYRHTISAPAGAASLLDYLASSFRHSSRPEWQRRILAGQVLLDGNTARPGSALRAGQTILWQRPPWREPHVPLAFAVLYRDDDVLAVAKPAGLPTMPAGGFLEHTLLHRVRRLEPGAAPVHRLGRWTSGLVAFARSSRARSALARSWRRGEVTKRYRALCSGTCSWEELEIDTPIGTVRHPLLGQIHAASPEGRAARSSVRVLERRLDCFLADVRIFTGRPHQIRIHLAAAGHPLVGDPLYADGGRPSPDGAALPGDPGYRLHAAELRLVHPSGGRELILRCAPPPCLRRGRPRRGQV